MATKAQDRAAVRAYAKKQERTTVLAIATVKPARKLSHPEAIEQRMFVRRWRMDPRTRDLPASAIPSGGKRSAREGAMMKADGLDRGLPDWMLFVPEGEGGGWRNDDGRARKISAAVEFKRPGGGRISEEQRRWHDALRAIGWEVAVVTSAHDAWAFVSSYLGLD